ANLTRFIYLKKKLRDLFPPTSQIWDDSIERRSQIDALRKTVLVHNDIYENDEMHVFPQSQSELWKEGFDEEKQKYIGSQWAKYLRAPEIYFQILQRCKNKLVTLSDLAKVRFGIKTGANEFFYLDEAEIKRKAIEKPFWTHKNKEGKTVSNKAVMRGREMTTPTINPENLESLILFISKDKKKLKGTNVLKYIEEGEQKNYNERETCANREPKRRWYDLGEDISDVIAFPQRFRQRHIVFHNPQNVSLNKNLYGVKPYNENLNKVIAIALNSTWVAFCLEIIARQPGGGGAPLDIDVYIAAKVLLPKAEFLEKHRNKVEKLNILTREIGTIFEELGADLPEEFAFEKVKKDRLELDKIILRDILGLSEAEHLEIYRSVIDLVSARLSRAKSVSKRNKSKGGSVADAMTGNIAEDLINGD
ncbi:MAG: hypothetical protein M3033_05470, partial [Acidobacteriota bacterium]|nr:hypothetical protein [Acidobacteriota bacterium]